MNNSAHYSLRDDLFRLSLLPSGQMAQLDRLQAQFSDSRALARELLRLDWLTAYQANQLFRGRGRELLLGSYVLLGRLGEGGMGRVFKARHRRMHRIAALKIIRREKLASPNALRRFHREVRLAAQLDHPNVVHAYDADQFADIHYFVMEYIEGTDLNRLVQKRGPLPVARACDYVRQAALGLQHVHERGLVHRDVKPHNLMLTPANRIKLLDVGLARSAEAGAEALTQRGVVLGSVDFLAPEQVTDPSSADPRADLYGLGCTLYFLLAGRVPFPARSAVQRLLGHLGRQPTPLNQLRPGLRCEVGAVVQRLMDKRPEARYPTAAALAQELDQLLPSLPWEWDLLESSSAQVDDETVEG